MIDPIARSGHLTDLGVEGLALDALSLPARIRAQRHLSTCDLCRQRAEALGIEAPRQRRRTWLPAALGATSLAAAALAWIGLQPPADPAFAPKGADTPLEIWVHDGVQPALLVGEQPVQPGERLGFRLDLDEAGHAMILAIDAQGDWAVVFPGEGDRAQWVEARDEQLLPVAVRLDDSEGAEWFHSVVCDDPFDVGDALRHIDDAASDGRCAVHTRRVTRAAED
ncbi:MAG: DUF4384 domain-containing protein [Myxococcales bacterium]|nr:DUF4384 domain-containing protein [Myxococcales bacterium]